MPKNWPKSSKEIWELSVYFESEIKRLQLEAFAGATAQLLALSGPLGAGKTTFVQEFLSTWSYDRSQVKSPSFLKLLEYRIRDRGLVLHIDCYRMETEEDIEKLSLESYEDVAALFIEWPNLFIQYLSKRPWISKRWGMAPQYWDVQFETTFNKASSTNVHWQLMNLY